MTLARIKTFPGIPSATQCNALYTYFEGEKIITDLISIEDFIHVRGIFRNGKAFQSVSQV